MNRSDICEFQSYIKEHGDELNGELFWKTVEELEKRLPKDPELSEKILQYLLEKQKTPATANSRFHRFEDIISLKSERSKR